MEEKRLTRLLSIYPFETFDRHVSELDSFLTKGGLMVIHHSALVEIAVSTGSIYRKTAS